MRIPPRNLASLILDQITTHPETHNQAIWDCATTKCTGGWACHFSDIKVTESTVLLADMPYWLLVKLDGKSFIDHQDRRAFKVFDVAQQLLGLDIPEAQGLLYDANEEEAVQILKELAAR